MIKIGGLSVEGDIGWPKGVNTFVEPHLLQPGEASDCFNVSRAPESAAWAHRPAFQVKQFMWGVGADQQLWSGPLQATCCQYDSDVHYAVRGGRMFTFEPTSAGVWVARCVTRDALLRSRGQVWLTGVPGGAIANDGRNRPVYGHPKYAQPVGNTFTDIRAGRAGVYTQGRFFYVTTDGKSILASDLDNPVSMQEAVDTNVYGWDAPERKDDILALHAHRVLNNDVELGDLVFSTGTNVYTVDTRGDRGSWSTSKLGRVQMALPDISFAGPRAAAVVNSNIFFRAAEPGMNLCMFNQLGQQFTQADAFSGQFLEADAWLNADGPAFKDWTVVASFGSLVLATGGPRVTGDGTIFHAYMLAFEAIKGTAEGLKFQGVWTGPRVLDISVARKGRHRGMVVWGLTDTGDVMAWGMHPKCTHDTTHTGAPKQIHSAVLSRGYYHQSAFAPKEPQTQEIFLRGGVGKTDITLAHRLSSYGRWQSIRTRSINVPAGTVGPYNFGSSTATGDTPGIPGGVFNVEQVLVAWKGSAALAGIGTEAKWVAKEIPSVVDDACGLRDFTANDPLADDVVEGVVTLDTEYL